jgi:hypothetical protein
MRPLERYMLPCDTGNPSEQERLRAWHATYNAALQGALARGDVRGMQFEPHQYASVEADRAHGRVGRVMFHEIGLPEYKPCDTRLEPVSEP